ncbi:unnamed protein product, partial [Brassica rapa subsp. trilocularis]
VPGTGTNRHDLYTMDNSRSKDTILSRAKDVVESDKLQKVIMEGSRDTSNTHVYELMIDPVGHQIIEKCTSEQTPQILDIVIQQPIQFVRICGDTHGYSICNVSFHNITCAIQDLMWSLCSEEKISRFMQTICHVALLLTKCTNTNHVISYCFRHFFAFTNPC